ncbi:MAG: hypothetical protein QXH13_01035, partial [Thermoplasmata archaeon]
MLRVGIRKVAKKHPILSNLVVTKDLVIRFPVEDSEEALKALGEIFPVVVEVITTVHGETARKKFITRINELDDEFKKYVPESLLVKEEKFPVEPVSEIYTLIFTEILETNNWKLSEELNEIFREFMEKNPGFHAEAKVGKVIINTDKINRENAIKILADAFSRFFKIFSFAEPEARKITRKICEEIYERYREKSEYKVVLNDIYFGAFSDTIEIPGKLSEMLKEVDRGTNFLVVASDTEILLPLYLDLFSVFLKSEGALVLTCTRISAQKWLDFLKLGIPDVEKRIGKSIILVDWCTHKTKKVVGVEEKDGKIVCDGDIANFGMGITKGLETVADFPKVLAVFDFLDESLLRYDTDTAIKFFTTTCIKISNARALAIHTCTKLFPDIENLSDGLFSAEVVGTNLKVKIERYSGEFFVPEIGLEVLGKGERGRETPGIDVVDKGGMK